MSATGSDVSMLANNFVSYLKGGLKTNDGGLATSFRVVNPLDPHSEPANINFHVERPYFELPQGGIPSLPQGGPGQPGPCSYHSQAHLCLTCLLESFLLAVSWKDGPQFLGHTKPMGLTVFAGCW